MSNGRGYRRGVVKSLSDMNIDEISLVDVGANQHAEIMISKRHAGMYDDESDTEEVEKLQGSYQRPAGDAPAERTPTVEGTAGRSLVPLVGPIWASAHNRESKTGWRHGGVKTFGGAVGGATVGSLAGAALGAATHDPQVAQTAMRAGDLAGGAAGAALTVHHHYHVSKGMDFDNDCLECHIKKDNPTGGDLHVNRSLGRTGEGPRMNKYKGDHAEVSESGSDEPDQDVDDGDEDEMADLKAAPVKDMGTTVAGVKSAKNVKKGFWTDLVSKVLAEDEESATISPTDITIPIDKHFPPSAGGQQPPQPPQQGQPAPQGPPAQQGQQYPGTAQPPPPTQATPPFGPGMAAQPAAGMVDPNTGQPIGQQMPAGPLAQPQPQMAQLPPEVIEYIEQLEDMVASLQGGDQSDSYDDPQLNNANNTNTEDPSRNSSGSQNGGKKMNNFGKSESYDDDEREFLVNLAKSLDDSEQDEQIAKAYELVEKAEERAQLAEQIAKAERDIRLTSEWVSKAGKYDVPVAPSELGPVLKRLSESVSTEDFAVIEKCLGSASEQRGIFAEFGKRGTGSNSDVFDEVEVKKGELIAKGISPAAAEAQVYALNPHLYDQYIKEQTSQR